MKIFTVDNNYIAEAAYGPVWFTVPDSVIVNSGKPFFLPDFDSEFEARASIAIKISRLGKSVDVRFAKRYYAVAAPALLIFATGLKRRLTEQGLPQDQSYVFDRALQLGEFKDLSCFGDILSFDIRVNGSHAMRWSESETNVSTDRIIETISSYNTIKVGDLILPALSRDAISLVPGQIIEATTTDDTDTLLNFHIK